MKNRVLALLTAGSLLAPLAFAQDANVPLYAAPDAATPVILSLKADDAQLAAAKPVADSAKAAAGWQAVEVKDVTGYAPVNTARKDLSISPGTPIRAAGDVKSAILGAAAANPTTIITVVQGDWAEVTFPGPVTAYLQKAVAPPPVEAAAPVAATVVAAAPAPTPAPAPVAAQPASVTASPALAKADATTAATPHYYYGIFKLRTDLKIAGPASAQYVLTSAGGQLLALLDLTNLSLARPVTEYLNQPVKVYGVPQPLSTFPSVMVNVQLLQVN